MSITSAELAQSPAGAEGATMTLAFVHTHVEWFTPDYTRQKLVEAHHEVRDFETDYASDGLSTLDEAALVLSGVEGLVVSRFHAALNPQQDEQTFTRMIIAKQLQVPIYDLHNSLFVWDQSGDRRNHTHWLQRWPAETAAQGPTDLALSQADIRQFKAYEPMTVWRRPRPDIVGQRHEWEQKIIDSMTRQGEQ